MRRSKANADPGIRSSPQSPQVAPPSMSIYEMKEWIGKPCCGLRRYRVASVGWAVTMAARETRSPCKLSESHTQNKSSAQGRSCRGCSEGPRNLCPVCFSLRPLLEPGTAFPACRETMEESTYDGPCHVGEPRCHAAP